MTIRFITRFFRFLSRTVRITRFEILLPLPYNDGATIEREKIAQTVDELSDHFGGTTQDLLRATGTWKYGGTRFRDELLRMRIDSDDPAAVAFLRNYKETLKQRLQQIDIWITAHQIQVI
jgi:hypothetical protein